MMLLSWWRDARADISPRFSWLRRKKPNAKPALKLSLIPQRPKTVEFIDPALGQTEPVTWLIAGPAPSVDPVLVVNLEPRPGRPEIARSPPSSVRRASGTTKPTNSSPRNEAGPTIVDRLRTLLAVPLELLLPGPNAVLDWPSALMPFQVEGVQELIKRDKILLADDMGLGKTLQTVTAIRILCVQRIIESALIVVPASILDQWRREFSKWAPELRIIIIRGNPTDRAWQWAAQVHVTLVSYETLLADFTNNPLSPPRRNVWDVVVIDEAQRIKNRNDTSDMIKRLQRKRSWALTGTPLENDVDDLASIMEFVDQGELTSTRRYHPGPELLSRHRELQLRRKKIDVLDQLPPKQVVKIAISLLPKQQASYDLAEREGIVHLRELGAAVRIQHVLELITRLKQICNADPETGESAKLVDIRDRLTILRRQGNRAIIFSQYTDESFGVRAVAKAIDDFEPLTFTGDMVSKERDRVIQLFKTQDSHKALVLSLRAGGLGLNLQEASYVFHVDRWWNPAIERQAEDRSHRYGQTVPVNVIKYMCIGTIEERIDSILTAKQELFNELIDDVSVDVGTRLTSTELFGLFGLEAPMPLQKGAIHSPGALELDHRCALILRRHGWSVQSTSVRGEGRNDVIGSRIDEVGIEETIYVQCLDTTDPTGVWVVRELIGHLAGMENVLGVLAAPAGVTVDAGQLARRHGIVIWNEARLLDLETATVVESVPADASEASEGNLEKSISSEDKLWQYISRRYQS